MAENQLGRYVSQRVFHRHRVQRELALPWSQPVKGLDIEATSLGYLIGAFAG